MATKKIASLGEIAGQMHGTALFVLNEIDQIRERVKSKRKPSKKDIFDLLYLLEVTNDSTIKTANAIVDYDQYLLEKRNIDTGQLGTIED